jgi:hypothetical protein
MPSYIADNLSTVGVRHYVMKATTDNHWFNFYPSQIATRQAQFGDDFCLIVNGSTTEDDAYVLPFAEFRGFFTDDFIDPKKNRWVGHIASDKLTLNRQGKSPTKSRPVRRFHNAFQLIERNYVPSAARLLTRRAQEEIADKVEAELGKSQGLFGGSPADRQALERYAVKKATAHFENKKFNVEDVGSRESYDLLCKKDDRELWVEVKATTTPGEQVVLTFNEADLKGDRALFVVHSIMMKNGKPSGGVTRIIQPWTLAKEQLRAIHYFYTLPSMR